MLDDDGRKYAFTADVIQDSDGRWTAWLVELPWCVTFGDSEEDAIRELNDAALVVVQYLESTGDAIPQRSESARFIEVMA